MISSKDKESLSMLIEAGNKGMLNILELYDPAKKESCPVVGVKNYLPNGSVEFIPIAELIRDRDKFKTKPKKDSFPDLPRDF